MAGSGLLAYRVEEVWDGAGREVPRRHRDPLGHWWHGPVGYVLHDGDTVPASGHVVTADATVRFEPSAPMNIVYFPLGQEQ